MIHYVKPFFLIFPPLKEHKKIKLSLPELRKFVQIIRQLLERLKSGGDSISQRNMLLVTESCGQAVCQMAATNDTVQALKQIWQWTERVTPTLSYILLVSRDRQSKA
jgi:hypothetical protein